MRAHAVEVTWVSAFRWSRPRRASHPMTTECSAGITQMFATHRHRGFPCMLG